MSKKQKLPAPKLPTIHGHYHLELADGKYFNGTVAKIKMALRRNKAAIASLTIICTYGCGIQHGLEQADLNGLGIKRVKAALYINTPALARC